MVNKNQINEVFDSLQNSELLTDNNLYSLTERTEDEWGVEIELTPEVEAALDRMWEEIEKKNEQNNRQL